MKFQIQIFLFALLLLTPFSPSQAAMPDSCMTARSCVYASGPVLQVKKPGLFQQFRAIKAVKKELREQGRAGDRASGLARFAMILFLSSIALLFFSIALGFLGNIWLFLFLFSVSPIIALIVLFTEKNPKSRKLAWITLGLWAVFLAALLVVAGNIN